MALALGIGLPSVQGGMMAAEMAVSTNLAIPDRTAAAMMALPPSMPACRCARPPVSACLPEQPMALAPDGETKFEIAHVSPRDCLSRTDRTVRTPTA